MVKRSYIIAKKLMQAGMTGKLMFSFAFAGAAIFWATPSPDPRRVILTLCAVFSARTAGCLFNNLVDRRYDCENERTRNRPLADGTLPVSVATAAIVLLALGTLFFVVALNLIYLVLLPVPLAICFLYSFTKRFTWLCHGILGIACSAAPVGSWIVFVNRYDERILLLGAMVTLWTAGYDILYSIQDVDFDKRKGLCSVPVRFGPEVSQNIARCLHVATAILFFVWGFWLDFGPLYFLGATLCSLLLVFEHICVSGFHYERIPLAFNVNQWIGMTTLVFAIIERYC